MIVTIHCASLLLANTPFLEKTDPLIIHEQTAYDEAEANEHTTALCEGIIHLFEFKPSEALTALEFATTHDQQNEATAIMMFCKVVAYDQLGSRDLALQTLDCLYNELFVERVPSTVQEEEADTETQEAVSLMNRLASLAPSVDIQQALHLIVEQISGKISSDFILESSGYLAHNEHQGGFSKFIKRWTHILKRVGQLIELIKNLEQIIKNSKGLINE
jgi:hypothetical protein